MSRPLRLEYAGALYHVTSRGNAKNNIYLHDDDFRLFLIVLSEVCTRFNWVVHAYCLMNNHYHLLIETPDANLSRGMRHLNGVYTQRFNRSHSLVGHLFQGRYKAILVDKESYLMEVGRYIVLNPVRAGMVEKPEDWPWSSFNAILGTADEFDDVATEATLLLFDKQRKRALKRYIEFIYDGIGQSIWQDLRHRIYLGDESFVENLF